MSELLSKKDLMRVFKDIYDRIEHNMKYLVKPNLVIGFSEFSKNPNFFAKEDPPPDCPTDNNNCCDMVYASFPCDGYGYDSCPTQGGCDTQCTLDTNPCPVQGCATVYA